VCLHEHREHLSEHTDGWLGSPMTLFKVVFYMDSVLELCNLHIRRSLVTEDRVGDEGNAPTMLCLSNNVAGGRAAGLCSQIARQGAALTIAFHRIHALLVRASDFFIVGPVKDTNFQVRFVSVL
jgi:hypothetical protein